MIRSEIIFSLIYFPSLILAQTQLSGTDKLAVKFDGKYGQVEVGGVYVGAEFHHSRPLPSRISFYYPVANSIDLSSDYWKRDESQPFKLLVAVDGRTDTIGTKPCEYEWTPYEADFVDHRPGYNLDISYRFCASIPFMVVKMTFTNESKTAKEFHVTSLLRTTLRTCQTYAWKDTADVTHSADGRDFIANFRYPDTDSASVVVVNAGEVLPAAAGAQSTSVGVAHPTAKFEYNKKVAPSGKFTIVQLIGSCKIVESKEMVEKARSEWKQDLDKRSHQISDYVYRDASINVPDQSLEQTAHWSKATLAADKHYIGGISEYITKSSGSCNGIGREQYGNGSVVPMPCPAEYNFFFTHDVLLTDLGAVFFDLKRVKNDLLYIRSLTQPDSILPHAYYWRDDGFKTEFALPDNWNHLWFMIVCGTYLKHSSDMKTLRLMYPILKKSAEMTLSNLGSDGLAYSTRPDWWDIGNNYGARSFLTALMVHALKEYSFVALSLGEDATFADSCLATSNTLQKNLTEKLWNSKVGYLLNTFDTGATDFHYFAGSLVAVDYDVLDKARSDTLMMTAQGELLDKNLGIRTAMPADFDTLTPLYRFKEGEPGAPYFYLNGAVWPQTTALYILGLIQLNRVDEARQALEKYLTITGIENSPNGQPSFYEYRLSNLSSPLYGRVDKPNFMWAGGWYLNTLYHLMGVRENEWNVSIVPDVPSGFERMDYDMTVAGSLCRFMWQGSGEFFKEIVADGKNLHSAVFFKGAKKVVVECGTPDSPYLESASCVIDRVKYDKVGKSLEINARGLAGMESVLTIVSPFPVEKVLVGKKKIFPEISSTKKDGIYTIAFEFRFEKGNEIAYLNF